MQADTLPKTWTLVSGAVCRGNANGLRPQLEGWRSRAEHTTAESVLTFFRTEDAASSLAAQTESQEEWPGCLSGVYMVETAAFDAFWKQYPRHIGKLAALKAYTKARRIATAQQILDGVDIYTRTKPAYADWCHPATWLNQGRWMDEPDTAARPSTRGHATQHVGQGPSARDLALIAQWEREHGKAQS